MNDNLAEPQRLPSRCSTPPRLPEGREKARTSPPSPSRIPTALHATEASAGDDDNNNNNNIGSGNATVDHPRPPVMIPNPAPPAIARIPQETVSLYRGVQMLIGGGSQTADRVNGSARQGRTLASHNSRATRKEGDPPQATALDRTRSTGIGLLHATPKAKANHDAKAKANRSKAIQLQLELHCIKLKMDRIDERRGALKEKFDKRLSTLKELCGSNLRPLGALKVHPPVQQGQGL